MITVTITGDRIKSKRIEKRLTQEQLANKVNKSKQVVSNWERGYSKPVDEDIAALSKVLSVSADYLLGTDKSHEINLLPPDTESFNFDDLVRIPILGTIRAGEPISMSEYLEGYTPISSETLRGREGFALRVKGDSMSGDRIQDGDVVVCVVTTDIEPSDIAVVSIDREYATLKRVKCQGDICILTSSNPAYQPILVDARKVHILGAVVEVKFQPKKY